MLDHGSKGSSGGASKVRQAIQQLKRVATQQQQEQEHSPLHTSTSSSSLDYSYLSTTLASSYEAECQRIHAAADHLVIPVFYVSKSVLPVSHHLNDLLLQTTKAFQLSIGVQDVEAMDDLQLVFRQAIHEAGSVTLSLRQFKAIIATIEKEQKAKESPPPAPVLAAPGALSPSSTATLLSLSPSLCSSGSFTVHRGGKAVLSSLRYPTPLPPTHRAEPPLDPVYVRGIVPRPRITPMLFFNSHPRVLPTASSGSDSSDGSGSGVEELSVFSQDVWYSYAIAASHVKSEMELLMWDTDGDGRLAENELENYIREMVPHVEAVRGLMDDLLLPFYCCTATRRIFWEVDVTHRQSVSLQPLLQSAVFHQWLQMQVSPDEAARSWFGPSMTRWLYHKFLTLDVRNGGTLDASDVKRYKKGLPTIPDDGLAPEVSPLSSLFVDRYFEVVPMMANGEMDFRRFVDFVLAVELLPQCARPLWLWRVLDVDGSGVLTPMKVNMFFRETHAKVAAIVDSTPAADVVLLELFDLIPTSEPLLITQEDFVGSNQAGLLVAIMIDCLSFWGYENRGNK